MTTAQLAKLMKRIEKDYPKWRKANDKHTGLIHRGELLKELFSVCQDRRKISAVTGICIQAVDKILDRAKGRASE